MIVIRKEQMKAFSEASINLFVGKVADNLKIQFSDQTSQMPGNELIKFVRKGMVRAENYGIKYEDEIEWFLRYLLRFGDSFDSEPAVKKIFTDGSLLSEEKINAVQTYFERNQ